MLDVSFWHFLDLTLESVEDIQCLFPVMRTAGSSMNVVHYAVPSFQGDCMFSRVGGGVSL